VLTQVAAAVESSQWYSMRLQDYLDHLPAMLEKGHLVAKFSSRLGAMHMPSECISEMHDMVKEVAVLSQCLRAGSTSNLQDQLLNKLRKLWSEIEESSSVKPKHLQQVSSLFSDASLVYPMDASMAAMTLACGELLQECSLSMDLLVFDRACDLVLEVLTAEPQQADAVLIAMKCLCEHSSNLRGIPSSLPTKSKKLATTVLQGAIDFFAKTITLDQKDMEHCLSCAEVLGSIVQEEPLTLTMNYLKQALQVKQKLDKLKVDGKLSMDEILGNGASLEKTVDLQRSLMKMKGMKKGLLLMISEQGCKQSIDEIEKDSAELVQLVNARRAMEASAQLEHAHTKLTDIAGGHYGGKHWLEENDASSFNELLQHATNTLMKINGKLLVDTTAQTEKALYHIVLVYSVCEDVQNVRYECKFGWWFAKGLRCNPKP
jgi:hypothetical protein